MPVHPRQAIRHALANLLKGTAPAHPTAAGARVFKNRVRPSKMPELPLLAVYTTDEDVDDGSKSSAPKQYRRNLTVVVEAILKAVDNADDVADSLCQEIEDVVSLNPRLGGLIAEGLTLATTEIRTWAEPSHQEFIVAVLTFEAGYDTYWPREGLVDADDLYRVGARFNAGGGQHAENQMQSMVTVQEEPLPEP